MKVITTLSGLHISEILPLAYVRYYEHFAYLWRNLCSTACGRWSHVYNCGSHSPRRDIWVRSNWWKWLRQFQVCIFFFEILPVAYVIFYQHFVYLWRISWFAASGRWSRTLLHIPQRDFSCWRKSGNWLNLLDLCTLLKSYLQPIRKAIARQSRDFAIDKRNVGNILRRPEVGFQKYAELESG